MMDFLLQHDAEPEKIQLALATFYQLKEGLAIEPWVEQENYHTAALTGDVALLLSVYKDPKDEMALARFLAQTLHTKVIIGDESLNPYSWVLIDEKGRAQPIYQDSMDEQEDGSFVVDSRYKYLLTQ